MYQLGIALPFWALGRDRGGLPKPRTEWASPIDLFPLAVGSGRPKRRYLYRAHFVLEVYGLNNSRWQAYAFERNYHDERFENDLEEEKCAFSYQGFQEDPIASDGTMDANQPACDPREYFLSVCDSRGSRAVREYKIVVHYMEQLIGAFVCESQGNC
jgi:hypothetical protein